MSAPSPEAAARLSDIDRRLKQVPNLEHWGNLLSSADTHFLRRLLDVAHAGIIDITVERDAAIAARDAAEAVADLLRVREASARADARARISDYIRLARERNAAMAEIERLNQMLLKPSAGHQAVCVICGEACNSLVGNPGLWPVCLGPRGWHHVKCVLSALAELERLRAPKIQR